MGFPRRLRLAAAIAALALPGAAEAAILDTQNQPVPNTAWTGLAAQLDREPGCMPFDSSRCKVLAVPNTPGDDSPAAVAALGHPESPVDDLAAALRRLETAADAAAATAARDEALAILEGGSLPGRAYDGIPLLNWNAPLKVKTVPANGIVDINEVRFPDHSVSDTWLLEFADPNLPYTIRYHVSELGGALGGELKPAPLLKDGTTAIGGVHSSLVPLAPPALRTGTSDASRFTTLRNFPAAGAPEETRTATQEISVRMPPPRLTSAILDPSTRLGAPSLLTLKPATTARLDAARAALGLPAGATPATPPTAAQRDAAIRRLAATSPERQIWEDLRALDSAAADFVINAQAAGRADGPLVDAMRTRNALPDNVAADPAADVTVVLQNNEVYVSKTKVRLAPGAAVAVEIINRDGFAHGFDALALHSRQRVLGAEDWGHFKWADVPGAGAGTIGPGLSRTITYTPPNDAFALWLGDDTGDQVATMLELDRGPLTQSIAVDPSDSAAPLHQAMDAAGNMWVTLTGIDKIVRVAPAEDFTASTQTSILIPNGRYSATSNVPPLAPADIAVDPRGIVWATLTLGNAVVRIDPSQVKDGTTDGVRVYPLPPCQPDECKAVFPPDPLEPPTREPLQLEVSEDAAGNALVWFTESAVNRIGLLRVAPGGDQLSQTHFTCGCDTPFGIALDPSSGVWFTEGVDNRIGRLIPGVTQPFAASFATLRHYRIPSAVPVFEPELSPVQVLTSVPHSVHVDQRGLVWFTESATSKLGVLDPDLAEPGTMKGMSEFDLPLTPFGAAATPADLTSDRDGKIYWADEYGDAIGILDASGPRAQWHHGEVLRPTARRSLTDSPVAAPNGDLWYIESGANRVTRVSGITAGSLGPAAAPRIDLELAQDAITGSGLREVSLVQAAVVRGGQVVAQGNAPVNGGAFDLSGGRWGDSAADRLRAGDELRITLLGAMASRPLTYTVPSLTAQYRNGAVTGHAVMGATPVAGPVLVDWNGARAAAVDPGDGAFRFNGTAETPGGPRSVAWTQASPGALVRTIAPVELIDAPPAVVPPAITPDPTPQGKPPITTDPKPSTPPRSAACPRSNVWLSTSKGRMVPAFIGMAATEIRSCLGQPIQRGTSRGVERQRYAGGLTLLVRAGRVTGVQIRTRAWTSTRGGLRVGAAPKSIRKALVGARAQGRKYRAVVALPAGGVADIRISVARGRVSAIDVQHTTAARLDRAGRTLLGGSR